MTLLKRKQMVDEQLVARGVADPRALAAMLKVERQLFVPDALQKLAYADEPLPIGYGQTISQPYIVAYMTEALKLTPDDRILEIGTGSGYQAAILSELTKEVYTMELVEPLAAAARERLASIGYKNIEVICGDGYEGLPEKAPFDAIMVTAAPAEVPVELAAQLREGGRMVVPVGSFFQELQLIIRRAQGFETRPLLPLRFVPMVRAQNRRVKRF
jgi:protein-L-isoaspartate(D-aspartate) O-methyltransferase